MQIFVTGTAIALTAVLTAPTAWAAGIDQFTIALEQTVADGVPGPGAGNIEVAGGSDEYTLTVAAGIEVYFDELSGPCGIGWSCVDANGDTVFDDNGFCSGDPGLHVLTLGGDYTITAFGQGSTTGTYSFIVWEVNPTDMFAIGLEEVVSDGVPGPGAGNIEEPGTSDVYTFSASAGTEVYFDELSGACGIRWDCVDANGDTVFTDTGMCSGDPGLVSLALGGTYTINARGQGAVTGTYSFTVWEVNPIDMFTIGLKEVVSDGVPGPGAGNIEEAGTSDVYILSASAGTEVYFEELSGACGISWSCTDSDGMTVFTDNGMCSSDPGVHELILGGDYTIHVTGDGDVTGTYSFTIWMVNPVETFSIGLEETVSDGVPGAGAGNIEEPGAMDVYTFSAAAGTTAYFDELSGPCGIRWDCVDANGATVFTDNGMCSSDPGVHELSLGGTYTISVRGEGATTGTYSFIVWDVNPTDVFDIAYGDIVSDGMPGPGAGNIEEPGTIDMYLYEGVTGENVCFTELDGPCGIAWVANDPSGGELFSDNGFCQGNPGTFTLPLTGTYTITVFGQGDNTGTYSFVATLGTASDINDDCLVNVVDLLIVLGAWGTPDGDVTGDDMTDVSDLLQVLADWT
jgi:hypothetical protein